MHIHTWTCTYILTHLRILFWPDKEGWNYHIDHWLQNLKRLEAKTLYIYIYLSDPTISIKAKRRSHRDHLWQYRASRSMATRHWTIISLMVQCLASNALRPSAAYSSNLPHNCSLQWFYLYKNILTRYSNIKAYSVMKWKKKWKCPFCVSCRAVFRTLWHI